MFFNSWKLKKVQAKFAAAQQEKKTKKIKKAVHKKEYLQHVILVYTHWAPHRSCRVHVLCRFSWQYWSNHGDTRVMKWVGYKSNHQTKPTDNSMNKQHKKQKQLQTQLTSFNNKNIHTLNCIISVELKHCKPLGYNTIGPWTNGTVNPPIISD